MEEKRCPICSEKVRSDATVHHYCGLCSMGLPDIKDLPQHTDTKGRTHIFCCERCLDMYLGTFAR